MFNESSGLVKLWVDAINKGTFQKEQCPKLSNLQEVVYIILDKQVV